MDEVCLGKKNLQLGGPPQMLLRCGLVPMVGGTHLAQRTWHTVENAPVVGINGVNNVLSVRSRRLIWNIPFCTEVAGSEFG